MRMWFCGDVLALVHVCAYACVCFLPIKYQIFSFSRFCILNYQFSFQVNLEELQKAMEKCLPPYARPVFIRQSSEIAKTGTFKFMKNKLRDEGFDPAECDKSDDLHYFNGKEKRFIPIDTPVYQSILNQEIRF